ncbi:fasciclin domain-containing protein [Kibdelosporangium phytohabitans]|uniref:fasciclin domain-containing protein n=1 Tax=Kibdelosporangium phytohabitans TaxID=860235 RepID=UPI0007C87C28|nr:fasciclin domain-containing protein [Kibdelosporangium phytohabitans]MBE1463585.1 putative surface protein with fasciclin (FAS1) repeats [Kibdelosporangium phytohabitans]
MRLPRAAAAVIGGVALMTMAACGSSDMGASSQPSQAPAPTSSAMAAQFGPACGAVPKDGPGSFDGMAKDPVATAASNNPVLSTLVTAVKQAGLVDTLNSAKDITVFAPTNEAFAKIPKADLDKVLADKEMLTKVLTHHVVGKTVSPTDLASGTFDTLAKDSITTSGSGESYKVGDANVVCGNVKTGNATVYLVDSVLMPAEQFGAACASIPKDGPGSFQGMAMDPVATAASNNPALSTLVTAVKQAGLVDTLNGLKGVTVFAPSNEAFAKLPKADLDKVLADKALLTKVLTYHVVPKTVTTADLAAGSFDTVEKGKLTTSGSGQDFTIGTGGAKVVCGNVKTANATVYIIDSVLMPPAA